MRKPSFAKINYTLRPNKNVERKLIVECLFGLNEAFPIQEYAYIGMGSMWFVDFVLVHKKLLIEKMISIEKEIYAERAEFNKPYDCIKVIPGDTSMVLPELDFESRPTIAWLDHETGLDGPVLEDVRIVCENAKNGSVLLVTVNANFRKLDGIKDKTGKPMKRVDALRQYAGDLVPPNLDRKNILERFPEVLAEILFAHVKSTIKASGRLERFYPLFNIFYRDTSPMLTIGGMIAKEGDKEKLDCCGLFRRFDCATGEKQFTINVPHLTVKEKIALDEMLPRTEFPSVEEIEEKGFPLDKEDIEAYCRFYRHYPVFGEFAF